MLTRITAPASPVVPLRTLKAQLKIEHAESDEELLQYQATAVARLDGFGGLLGRAILPQTWEQEFGHWGMLRLALPDVSEATATYLDAEGAEQPATSVSLRRDFLGSYVEAEGPAATRIFVTFTAAMPEELLPAVRQAIILMVKSLHDGPDRDRERAVMDLINPIRVRRT